MVTVDQVCNFWDVLDETLTIKELIHPLFLKEEVKLLILTPESCHSSIEIVPALCQLMHG